MRSPAGVRQRAQPDGQRSLRRCPQGERSESIPLSPPHSEEEPERKFRLFFCILHGEGVRSPAGVRQRAQPDGQRSLRRCPQGERSESIPLSPPHSEEEPERKFRLFFAYSTERGEKPRRGAKAGAARWTAEPALHNKKTRPEPGLGATLLLNRTLAVRVQGALTQR